MNVFMVGLTCLNVACMYEWITVGFTDVVCLGRNGFGLYPPMVNNGGSICSDSIICMIFILKTNSLNVTGKSFVPFCFTLLRIHLCATSANDIFGAQF